MKQFTKIILTTFVIVFLASCNKEKEATPASSASIVGKWTFSALAIKTDTKTEEATLAEIKKLDADAGNEFGTTTLEFKADGSVNSSDGSDKSTGKYVLSNGNKTLSISDDKEKDANGKPVVQAYEVISISASEMALGLFKSDKKDKDGEFIFNNDDDTLSAYFIALVVYSVKKLDPQTEIDKAKSFQILLKFKK